MTVITSRQPETEPKLVVRGTTVIIDNRLQLLKPHCVERF